MAAHAPRAPIGDRLRLTARIRASRFAPRAERRIVGAPPGWRTLAGLVERATRGNGDRAARRDAAGHGAVAQRERERRSVTGRPSCPRGPACARAADRRRRHGRRARRRRHPDDALRRGGLGRALLAPRPRRAAVPRPGRGPRRGRPLARRLGAHPARAARPHSPDRRRAAAHLAPPRRARAAPALRDRRARPRRAARRQGALPGARRAHGTADPARAPPEPARRRGPARARPALPARAQAAPAALGLGRLRGRPQGAARPRTRASSPRCGRSWPPRARTSSPRSRSRAPRARIESYHAYVDERGDVAGSFTGRKIRTFPEHHGHSTAVEITAQPDVAALGREILDALRFRGVAKVDFKRDARRPAAPARDQRALQPLAPARRAGRRQPARARLRRPHRPPATGHRAGARRRDLVPAAARRARRACHGHVAAALAALGARLRRRVRPDAARPAAVPARRAARDARQPGLAGAPLPGWRACPAARPDAPRRHLGRPRQPARPGRRARVPRRPARSTPTCAPATSSATARTPTSACTPCSTSRRGPSPATTS